MLNSLMVGYSMKLPNVAPSRGCPKSTQSACFYRNLVARLSYRSNGERIRFSVNYAVLSDGTCSKTCPRHFTNWNGLDTSRLGAVHKFTNWLYKQEINSSQ